MSKGWGFDMRNIDKKIRPQDDFYHYANGGWLKRTSIPSDESWWGSFSVVRRKTDTQLRSLVQGLLKKRNVKRGTSEQMVRDLYRSSSDIKKRRSLGVAPLNPYLERVQAIKSYEDLYEAIAVFHRMGVGALWGLSVGEDAKNNRRHVLHVYQDGLGMPERDYYLKDGPEQKRIRTAYGAYIKALMRLVGASPKESQNTVITVLRIETKLARLSMTKEEARDENKVYNKKSFKKLTALAPNIPWRKYFVLQNMPLPKEVIVAQPKFIRGVDKLMRTTPLEDWKTYLSWHVINDFSGALSPAFIRARFSFYGTALFGVRKMQPLWRRALGSVNGGLGELLGQLYIKKYFTPATKKLVN